VQYDTYRRFNKRLEVLLLVREIVVLTGRRCGSTLSGAGQGNPATVVEHQRILQLTLHPRLFHIHSIMITSPQRGVQSFVMSMSVCMSARITRKPHGQYSPHCARCLWPWFCLPLTALRYVMCSCFVDNAMSSDNGPMARHEYF